MRLLSFFLVWPQAFKNATAILIILFALPVYAQDNEPKSLNVPTPDYKVLKDTQSGRVDKIIDSLTILLKDDTIIRLASLDIPDFNDQDAPISENALMFLQKTLPEGTEIKLYQTRMAKKGRVNRMNHQLGHIVTKRDELWVNGALLTQGLTRVYTAPNAPELINEMYEAENLARQAQLGLWASSAVLTPEQTNEAIGKLVIVEGIVEKTASVKNNVYLNFGENWKTDFTIMITPALRKKLARRGVDPLSLSGKNLRVRGYLREYNGPLIELEAAEHLEYPLLQDGS